MKLLIATSFSVIAAVAPDARADVSAAARAFSEGQAALLDGDYAHAAQDFELAFNIAPSREALRSAVRARQLAGQLPRAATLAQLLATQYADDADSARLASEVLTEARAKLARISVACPARCTVAIAGRATSLNAAAIHVVFTPPGHHYLEITFDGDRTVKREVTLRAGDDVTLPVEPPRTNVVERRTAPVSPSPRPAARDSSGLPPAVALGGGALTLVVAGITTWSALDTVKAHDAYVAAPTPEGWKDGRSRQLRTNILLGTAAATGIATALVAVFWTRWDGAGDRPAEVAIAPSAGGLTLVLGGRY